MNLRIPAVVLAASLLVPGCVSTVELKSPHPYGADFEDQPLSWHHVRLKWHWPEEQAADWPLDLLIADRVFSDLITEYQGALPLWRFHRRAARDTAGHQFSFIFYGSEVTADAIIEDINNNELVNRLLEKGRLEDVHVTTPGDASELQATSDSNWPDKLQSVWPMFIMGVSQSWLGLVETHADSPPRLAHRNVDALIRYYSDVNEEVNEVWNQYAQHAFFHHISGVFGYQPVGLRMRF